jgi:3-hydroxyisobutyrate dehydrogenase-like beta-hydroxyacid dehydrogenase
MPRTSKTHVGVIGLGIIGSRVAARLRDGGFQVWVWSRSPRPEPNFLPSAAEVAESAKIVQIFVSDGAALHETVGAMAPVLTPQHIVLNHATVSPSDAQSAASMVEGRHAAFLDAPFTGSRDAAAAGEMVYFLGGDPKVIDSVRPVLEASSKALMTVGGIGDASALKVATNLIAAASVEAYAEALALLHRSGVPLEALPEALENHAAGSALAGMKVPAMILDDFEPRFALKHMFKDVKIALGMAKDAGMELPAAAAFAGAAVSAMQNGQADADFSSIARLFGFPDTEASLPEKFRSSTPSAPVPKDDHPARKTWNIFGRGK